MGGRRLLVFLFYGTAFGGLSAAILGLLFNSGEVETLVFEVGIYVVVGMIAGFFGGLICHLLSYTPPVDVDPALPAPGLDENFTGINRSIAIGIGAMVVAVVWFVVGIFMQNKIYFYPPVLFVGGLMGFLKGVFFPAK